MIPVKATRPELLGGDEHDKIQHQEILGVLADIGAGIISIAWCKKEEFRDQKG